MEQERTVVEMVEYVEAMPCEGVPLKNIAAALCLQDPRQLKIFMSKMFGYEFSVYHRLSLHEVCDKIEELIPIEENACNWGMR